jgi:hypothetical protein
MRREDMELWNGVLKGVIQAELEIENAKTLKAARERLQELKHRVEQVHYASMDEVLRYVSSS